MPDTAVRGLAEWLIPGIVQGLTEIFPVSSSAHLALFSAFWKSIFNSPGPDFASAIFLHLSMFLAVLIAYGRELKAYLLDFLQRVMAVWHPTSRGEADPRHWRVVPGFLLATGVTALIGVPLKDMAESLFSQPILVAGLLILNGIILYVTGSRQSEFRGLGELQWKDYIWIGIMQGCAVVPGLSRFGLVLCTALWLKLTWFEALKLSFLISLPVILGINIYEIAQTLARQPSPAWSVPDMELAQFLFGILLATIISLVAIRILRRGSLYAYRKLNYFGLYSIAVGLFSAAFFGLLG